MELVFDLLLPWGCQGYSQPQPEVGDVDNTGEVRPHTAIADSGRETCNKHLKKLDLPQIFKRILFEK